MELVCDDLEIDEWEGMVRAAHSLGLDLHADEEAFRGLLAWYFAGDGFHGFVERVAHDGPWVGHGLPCGGAGQGGRCFHQIGETLGVAAAAGELDAQAVGEDLHGQVGTLAAVEGIAVEGEFQQVAFAVVVTVELVVDDVGEAVGGSPSVERSHRLRRQRHAGGKALAGSAESESEGERLAGRLGNRAEIDDLVVEIGC